MVDQDMIDEQELREQLESGRLEFGRSHNSSFIVRVPAQVIDYSSFVLGQENVKGNHYRNNASIGHPMPSKSPSKKSDNDLQKKPSSKISHVNPFSQQTTNRIKQFHLMQNHETLLSNPTQHSNRSLLDGSGSRHSPASDRSFSDSNDQRIDGANNHHMSPSRNQWSLNLEKTSMQLLKNS